MLFGIDFSRRFLKNLLDYYTFTWLNLIYIFFRYCNNKALCLSDNCFIKKQKCEIY